MAFSYVKYTATAGQTNFIVTFPYMLKSHVSVLKNGTPAAFTWPSVSTITLSAGAAAGDKITIQRTTPKTSMAASNDGSVLTNTVLATLATQNIFLSEEAQDAANDANATSAAAVALITQAVDDVEESAGFAADAAEAAQNSAAAAAADADDVENRATTIAAAAAATATNLALGYRDAASASASAAAATAASVAAVFDSFDDRYLGPKASAPALDNDGNALMAGALYWDTTLGLMRSYSGSGGAAGWTSITPGMNQTDADLRYAKLTGSTITNAALVNPALGTPASGNLANCTGFPTATFVANAAASQVVFAVQNNYYTAGTTGSIGAAGQVWLLVANFSLTTSGNNYLNIRIWNGSTAVAQSDIGNPGNVSVGGALTTIVTLTGPTTFSAQAVNFSAAQGNIQPGSGISAVRIK